MKNAYVVLVSENGMRKTGLCGKLGENPNWHDTLIIKTK